jgi:hypothetical protein
MNKVLIRIGKGYRIQDFVYGYSLTNNVSTVQNWQDSNVLRVQNGSYWFFCKNHDGTIYFSFFKQVNCENQPCSIQFVTFSKKGTSNCTITGLNPYYPITGNSCLITGLSPYVVNGLQSCTISALLPYIKTADSQPQSFIGVIGLNV